MDAIIKARELGVIIRNSQEMLEFQKAEKALNDDIEAQKLIHNSNNLSQSLSQYHLNGENNQDKISETNEKLKIAFEEMMKNSSYKKYYDASIELNKYIKSIRDAINEEASIPENNATKRTSHWISL